MSSADHAAPEKDVNAVSYAAASHHHPNHFRCRLSSTTVPGDDRPDAEGRMDSSVLRHVAGQMRRLCVSHACSIDLSVLPGVMASGVMDKCAGRAHAHAHAHARM